MSDPDGNNQKDLLVLAQELGENDVASRYEKLRKECEAEYNEQYQEVQKLVDETSNSDEEDE